MSWSSSTSLGVWCRILREKNSLKLVKFYRIINFNSFSLQANAENLVEEDGEMEDDENKVQQPTVLKVKLFNK